MPEKTVSFQQIQYAFAAYIRDPNRNPPPHGTALARMRVYRELFFNNIENFLANGFPVIKSILSKSDWFDLVQDFYAKHRSKTPYFAEIAEEFLDYLQNERDPCFNDPPYLLELAHYEWTELALAIAEGEAPQESAALMSAPLEQTIYISEVAWPMAYRFPVHKIGPGHEPTDPSEQPTCLVVYRNREDTVKFLEISPVTYRLLQILEEEGSISAKDCMLRVAKELGYSDPEGLASHGAETLRALGKRGIIGAIDPPACSV
jgi:hypothetical protein